MIEQLQLSPSSFHGSVATEWKFFWGFSPLLFFISDRLFFDGARLEKTEDAPRHHGRWLNCVTCLMAFLDHWFRINLHKVGLIRKWIAGAAPSQPGLNTFADDAFDSVSGRGRQHGRPAPTPPSRGSTEDWESNNSRDFTARVTQSRQCCGWCCGWWCSLFTWINNVIYLHGYRVPFLLDNCYYLALDGAAAALRGCLDQRGWRMWPVPERFFSANIILSLAPVNTSSFSIWQHSLIPWNSWAEMKLIWRLPVSMCRAFQRYWSSYL